MSLPAQTLLSRLVGYYNNRPVYASVCNPPVPGVHLGRLVGRVSSRAVYAIGNCTTVAGIGAIATGEYIARLVGQRTAQEQLQSRPIYALACCGVPGPSVSASAPSSVISESLSSAVSESAASASSVSAPSLPSVSVPSVSLPSFSGVGSSLTGSGGISLIQTKCCANPLPYSFFATITNNANCVCLDGITLELVFSNNRWSGCTASGGCLNTPVCVELVCDDFFSLWFVAIRCGNGDFAVDPVLTPESCDPFYLTARFRPEDGNSPSTCCTNGDITITIVE